MTSTVGTGGGMSTTAGTGGSGIACGGKQGVECGSSEFCDFPDDRCGIADGLGTCTPRPVGCPKLMQPTCGCDGKVHGNPCESQSVGVDIANVGGCPMQPGLFACGARFCDQKEQYCRRTLGQPGGADVYECISRPTSCSAPPTCDCISTMACANQCISTMDGGIIVTCG